MKLLLYTGPDCHLCELAKKELALLPEGSVEVELKNIKDNINWYHFYAMRIPVLQREDDNSELNWPFTMEEIRDFIE